MLETTDLAIEHLAAEAGFGSAAVMREHFGTVLGTSPLPYRRAFSRVGRSVTNDGVTNEGERLITPEHLHHPSQMEGDPLADMLTLAGARCVRIGTLKAGGTWALRFPPPQQIKLTAVVKGACWLAVDGERAPVRLETGDVFVVPAARPFVLASDLKVRALDGLELFTKAKDNVGTVGDGNDFLSFGGHVALDPDRGGLLAEVLPPLIHVGGNSPDASTIRWLLDQLLTEVAANRPGAVLASKQLAQLLFVQIIRFYLAASNPLTAGWLRALSDERLAPALRDMHREPGRDWHLDELAKQTGMSRTSFATRFKASAGVAPLTYLLNLRMRLAEHELRAGARSVSELAESLGYASDSAFSNAFKRSTGMAPKHYQSIVGKMDEATLRDLR